MEQGLVISIFSLPLLGFILQIFFGGKLNEKISGYLSTLLVAIPFFLTVKLFIQYLNTSSTIEFSLWTWLRLGKFSVDFAFLIDALSLTWMLFITGIGSLIHLYSVAYMHGDKNFHKFFAYLNLFIFFMLVLVMGNNLLVMFIGWEGVGLCSYLLIGFWYQNDSYNHAANKAFIMNRIGDMALVLGVFVLAYMFSTLNYKDLSLALSHNYSPRVMQWIAIAGLLLFIGATGKSAQIPLYTWLPDAMAGPTPVSALIHAATMVTAGIYMVARMNFLYDISPWVQEVIAVVGVVTALFAATIGLVQTDIKKILAYSTVSQLGLMFLALGMGAYTAAVFHVITHAFFKACLFLGSGSVIHGLGGEQDVRKMGFLKKAMPITYLTMFVSTLAISGIPPFSGFFSKDEILISAFHSNIVLYLLASITSVLTAFYMFRLMFLTFYNDFRGRDEQRKHLHESPWQITVPLIILAILALFGGIIGLPGNNYLHDFLQPVFVNIENQHELHLTEYILMGVAVVGASLSIFLAYYFYITKKIVPPDDRDWKGFKRFVYEKYRVDEFYNFIIARPLITFSNFLRNFFERWVYGFFMGLGTTAYFLSFRLRKIQSGGLGLYFIFFVLGVSALILFIFLI